MVMGLLKANNEVVKPLILKLGLALALSFAGFIYSQLRFRKRHYLPPPQTSSGGNKNNRRTKFVQERGLRTIHSWDASLISSQEDGEIYETISIENPITRVSSSHEHSEDEDRFVYPELDELYHELEYSSVNTDMEAHTLHKRATHKDTNQEIMKLRNMVKVLQEREMKLEIELLEYYGLKEQETAVMELENRLKINNVEAQLYILKIESLQADKKRMEEQVADFTKVMTELESAKAKIKLLKRKIKSNAEQSKEQISALQDKVKALLDQEIKNAKNKKDVESRLQRLAELEQNTTELRKANLLLQNENSEMASRLKSTEIIAFSDLEDPQVDALLEENSHLKLENENLLKAIERVQADRCSDVEELVYLRWLNACMRYELRNQKVPPGRTVARDLSKSLSPRSEAKAKQLILEYASLEGLGEKGVSLMDIDSDYWSSSRNSTFTDSTDYDDTADNTPSTTRTYSSTKSKFYSKLKRLVRKGDNNNSIGGSPAKGERASVSSLEDMMGTGYNTPQRNSTVSKTSECKSNEKINTAISSKSLDFARQRSLSLDDSRFSESNKRRGDLGYLTVLKESDDDDNSSSSNRDTPEKLKLMKFAAALTESRRMPTSPRKLPSFPSYGG